MLVFHVHCLHSPSQGPPPDAEKVRHVRKQGWSSRLSLLCSPNHFFGLKHLAVRMCVGVFSDELAVPKYPSFRGFGRARLIAPLLYCTYLPPAVGVYSTGSHDCMIVPYPPRLFVFMKVRCRGQLIVPCPVFRCRALACVVSQCFVSRFLVLFHFEKDPY